MINIKKAVGTNGEVGRQSDISLVIYSRRGDEAFLLPVVEPFFLGGYEVSLSKKWL